MCGRYDLNETVQDLVAIIDRLDDRLRAHIKTGEIHPTDLAPVLIGRDLEPTAMTWGYPRWGGASGVVFNARAETADRKRMFARSLKERRCVIPTTGFYEWRHETGPKKVRYHFSQPETPITWIAGIWGNYEQQDCFCMLTTAANASITAYHDRMPVVIDTNERVGWCNGDLTATVLSRPPPPLIARKCE